MTHTTYTQCICRIGDEYKRVDVLASVKITGHIFLVHRGVCDADMFSATYAPVGMAATDEHATIDAAIESLWSHARDLDRVIDLALDSTAEQYMPLLSPETGLRRDDNDNDWQCREQCRFDNGEYTRLPDLSDVIKWDWPAEHYLHLSATVQESDFVAYTPNEAYGIADRQVRLKFGKYLRKTFADLSDHQIQLAVASLRAKLALKETPALLQFATDRDTITWIFETPMFACDSDVVSCMYNKFSGTARPYHVYADSPDVAIAYLMERGNLIARSVVSTKDKVWIRPYAIKERDSIYCNMLLDLLQQAGYTEGELNGNRLTNLGAERLPYLDYGGKGVIDCGKYWEVCEEEDGDYRASNTDGTGERRRLICDRCECDEDECECIYCACCTEYYYPECPHCSQCEDCDECMEHGRCQCERCANCGDLVEPNSRYANRCECGRCCECNRLTDDCECEPEAIETKSAEVSA